MSESVSKSLDAKVPKLDLLFRPQSVAVVGVSANPAKLGSSVFSNLIATGYCGKIYAVGRRNGAVGEHSVHPAIAAIGDSVDVAFLAVPAPLTEEALAEAAAAGVKFAIIGSSGFAESGDTQARSRITEIVRKTGIRIVGPNCNGIYNADPLLSLGFNRAHQERWPAGGVSIVSHSGALFYPLMRLLTAAGAGLASFVSTGNEDDLDALDYTEFLVEDPQTRVIALIIDALSDERRFGVAVRRAQALGKAIIVLKLGQTSLGAATACAHSSRLSGSYTAYSALFEALGVPTVSTIEGLMAAAAAIDRFGVQRSGKLGVITTSGAGGALIADLSARHDISLAKLSIETEATLDHHRLYSTVGNPVDLGIFGSDMSWSQILRSIAEDADVGVVLVYFHSFGGSRAQKLLEALDEAQVTTGVPILALSPGGLEPEEAQAHLERGLLLLTDTDSALQAAGALLRVSAPTLKLGIVPNRVQPQVNLVGQITTEAESLSELARWGVPVVPFCVCCTLDQVLAAVRKFGLPVAMKSMITGEAHKTEKGHVKLNLATADAVIEAFNVLGTVGTVIVQPMIDGELEAIAGISQTTPGTGAMLMTGLGGIHVEAIADIALWPLWAPKEFIEDRIRSTRLGQILLSPRWKYIHSFDRLLDALLALRDFGLATEADLEAVDINPLIIGAQGVIAVDALIVGRNLRGGS